MSKITVFDKQAESPHWFITATGINLEIDKPSPSLIEIEDIARGLSNISRWGGQSRERISVAQHSCIVAHLAPHPLRPVALMHDATEAYLGDVIRPIKNIIKPLYKPLEDAWTSAIFERFNLDVKQLHEVKIYDLEALELEFQYMHGGDSKFWSLSRSMFAGWDGIWSADQAYHNFMKLYSAYILNR